MFPSPATDSDGKAYVTWQKNNYVKYICYNNGVWENEHTVNFGMNPTIDISSVGKNLSIVFKQQTES